MKPKGPIWQNFDSITKDGSQRAVCKNCSKDMVPDAKRMKKHHDDCIATSSSAETVPKKVPKQTTLFNVMTSQEKQHEIELQIGRYFVSSNTAFRQVENQEFQKLVQKLKPGVEIPNRKRLAGPILDELYNEEQKKVKALCSGMMGTLAIDGWSTVTNEPVIGVNVTTNSGSYLVDTVDTSGFPHNSEYLASLTKEQIDKIKNDWGIKIYSVVTDNASNMAKMRQLIYSDNEILHTYGCQAHAINLVAKDVSKMCKDSVSKVVAVLKHLRNHQLLLRPILSGNFRPSDSLTASSVRNSGLIKLES